MKQSLWKLALLKSSTMLINTSTWIWHSLLVIFIKFLQLSNGVGIPIFQENSLSFQNQDSLTIRTIKEHGSMLSWSRIGTSIIHGCSISHLSIRFLLCHFGSTIGGLILVRMLRFFQNPYWIDLSYLIAFLLSPENFQCFPLCNSSSVNLASPG